MMMVHFAFDLISLKLKHRYQIAIYLDAPHNQEMFFFIFILQKQIFFSFSVVASILPRCCRYTKLTLSVCSSNQIFIVIKFYFFFFFVCLVVYQSEWDHLASACNLLSLPIGIASYLLWIHGNYLHIKSNERRRRQQLAIDW